MAQHDVGRLDVAVDHAIAVRVAEGIEQLARHAHGILERELEVEVLRHVEVRRQLFAAHQFHHHVGDAVFLAEVVQADDVRMVQPRDGLRLADEAGRIGRAQFRVGIAGGGDDLDRDAAVQARIEAFVDLAHGAASEHAHDPVSA